MNKEQKIKKLEQTLSQVTEELNKLKSEDVRFIPELEEKYHCINEHGRLSEYTNEGDNFDRWSMRSGNCFKTRKEAEDYRDYLIKNADNIKGLIFKQKVIDRISELNGDWEWKKGEGYYIIVYGIGGLYIDYWNSAKLTATNKMIKSVEVADKIISEFDNYMLFKYFI